ncbi:MAG: hypothetical protein SGILL_010431 [Bacillariaceae sp.]
MPQAATSSSSLTAKSTLSASASIPSPSRNPYPQGAVSTAVRCKVDDNTVHYLLIQRGKAPNADKWSFPGGHLEWGETALEGAQRELAEETNFEGLTVDENDSNGSHLRWYSEPYSTADSIIPDNDNFGGTSFHYLIAISFAELILAPGSKSLPNVTPHDDAKKARWWTIDEIQNMDADMTTPGLLQRVERAEFLYQKGVLL